MCLTEGVNFLRHLAWQKKKLDDSSRLDVVEIARVPDMLVSFLVGPRTYQHPGIYITESHRIFLYVSVRKGQSSGRQTKAITIKITSR